MLACSVTYDGGLDVYVIGSPPVSGHVERVLTVNICVDRITGLLDWGPRVRGVSPVISSEGV